MGTRHDISREYRVSYESRMQFFFPRDDETKLSAVVISPNGFAGEYKILNVTRKSIKDYL